MPVTLSMSGSRTRITSDRETGEGITNTDIDAGRRVAVVGIKGLEAFRSERGLAAAGPRYFGFDIDYVPIEKLMAETSS